MGDRFDIDCYVEIGGTVCPVLDRKPGILIGMLIIIKKETELWTIIYFTLFFLKK